MILPNPIETLSLAYLDPASGGIIVQAIVAGVAGLFVFFKYQGRRVMRFLGLKKDAEPEPAPEDRDDE